MNAQSRRLSPWLVMLLAWCGVSHAEDWSSMCGNGYVALGQHTVTPAEVIGAPGEQLAMHPSYPVKKEPYLISGDRVELVTTCDAYAFVRFQGHSRVSAGWVKQSRLRITGKSYVPLPRNAPALCQAAQDLLNKSGSFEGLTAIDMKPAALAEEETLQREDSETGSIDRVARLRVGGRTIVAVSSLGGGTCHSTHVSLWSSDLSTSIDAPDVGDRDPFHDTDDNAWDFGKEDTLVDLLGEPMVLIRHSPFERFYLSLIQPNGDVRPVCEGMARSAGRERLSGATDGALCGSLAKGKGSAIELSPPLPAETLSVQTPGPSLSFSRPKPLPDIPGRESGDNPGGDRRHLDFFGSSGGFSGSYFLQASGIADLDNSGHLHRVGMIRFEFESDAGCGSKGSAEAPVLIDDKGNADPSTPVNKALYAALLSGLVPGVTHTHLLRYASSTYVEIVPGENGTRNEIWKIDREGPHLVCQFHPYDYVVQPLSP